MARDQHTIEVPDGAFPSREDRTLIGVLANQANPVGSAAGAIVTVAVAIDDLPDNYAVSVNPGQDCRWYVDAKTNGGFNVNLVPVTGTDTIAAGTFDVAVLA